MKRKELQQLLEKEGLLKKFPFFSLFGEKKDAGSYNYIKKTWFYWYYIAQGDRGSREILFKSRSEDEVCAFVYEDIKNWDKNIEKNYNKETIFGRNDILYSNYQPHLPSYSLAKLELREANDIHFDFGQTSPLKCKHLYEIKRLLCLFLDLRCEKLTSIKAVRYNLLQGIDTLLFEIQTQDQRENHILCNVCDGGIASMILFHFHFFEYGEITIIEKTESELLTKEKDQCIFKYVHSLTNRISNIDKPKSHTLKKEGFFSMDKTGTIKCYP